MNDPISYTCACPAGHTGTNCDTEIADFNNDGHLDMLSNSTQSQSPLVLVLGNGDGTFQAGQPLSWNTPAVGTFQIGSATPFPIVDFALGDWDGDGHTDVAGTRPNLGKVSVRLGNGDGAFQAEGLYSGFTASVIFRPRSITARDFDENGSPDLLVGGKIDGLRFMRNLNASITP